MNMIFPAHIATTVVREHQRGREARCEKIKEIRVWSHDITKSYFSKSKPAINEGSCSFWLIPSSFGRHKAP